MKAKMQTSTVMHHVIVALMPGLAVITYTQGMEMLLNCFTACLLALILEGSALALRRKTVFEHLYDGSALITALLLTLSLPTEIPYWQLFIGLFFALVVAKQLYGGLGQNLFNPAMVGYVVLLISFPVSFSNYTNLIVDGTTGATPFTALQVTNKTGYSLPALGLDWPLILAWSLGAVYLKWLNIIKLLMPVVFLLTLTLGYAIAIACHAIQADVLLMILHSSTIFCALFILTDPVTAPSSKQGQILFALGVALLTFVIRNYSSHADGLAFAILIMNALVPLINRGLITKARGI